MTPEFNSQKKDIASPTIDLKKIEDAISKMLREVVESGNFPNSGAPLFFSISMKIDADGKARIEKFGNVGNHVFSEKKVLKEEDKSVFTDIIESEKDFTITLELPLVNEKELEIRVFESKIVVTDSKPEGLYKQVLLRKPIVPKKTASIFKNGVLEIVAPKKEEKEESI